MIGLKERKHRQREKTGDARKARRGKGGEDEDGARREGLTVDALIISLC